VRTKALAVWARCRRRAGRAREAIARLRCPARVSEASSSRRKSSPPLLVGRSSCTRYLPLWWKPFLVSSMLGGLSSAVEILTAVVVWTVLAAAVLLCLALATVLLLLGGSAVMATSWVPGCVRDTCSIGCRAAQRVRISLCRRLGLVWEIRVLMLGLDNSGKSTLVHVARGQRLTNLPPTLHPNRDEIELGDVKVRFCDVGGFMTARRMWQQLGQDCDAVIFVVDAGDPCRFAEVRDEITRWKESRYSCLPLVILANKIDRPTAPSEAVLRRALCSRVDGVATTELSQLLDRSPSSRGLPVEVRDLVLGYHDEPWSGGPVEMFLGSACCMRGAALVPALKWIRPRVKPTFVFSPPDVGFYLAALLVAFVFLGQFYLGPDAGCRLPSS